MSLLPLRLPLAPPVRVFLCLEPRWAQEALTLAWAGEPGLAVSGVAGEAALAALRRLVRARATPAFAAATEVLPDVLLVSAGVALQAVVGTTAAALSGRLLVVGWGGVEEALLWLRRGARGYLAPDTPLPLLRRAIEEVHRGELWAPPRVVSALLAEARQGTRRAAPLAAALTVQEQRVLELLGEGRRNKEIAAALGVAESTVKSHLNRVYRKLQLSDRLQAGLLAARQAWAAGESPDGT